MADVDDTCDTIAAFACYCCLVEVKVRKSTSYLHLSSVLTDAVARR